jgi:hypothetical protein
MPTNQFDATSAFSTPMNIDYQQMSGTPIPGIGPIPTMPQVFNSSGMQQSLSDSMIKNTYNQQLFSTPDFAKALRDKAFLQRAYREQGLK